MKKIIAVVISSMLILVAFTACGGGDEGDFDLTGTWRLQIGDTTAIYEFTKDSWSLDAFGAISKGTYTITGNQIKFVTDDGNPLTQSFSHKGNTITIGGQQYTRQK